MFYLDALNLPTVDMRAGWSEFGSGDVTIALHRGKSRKPRFEFVTDGCLEESREYFNGRGARLGPVKEVRGKRIMTGRDKDEINIQVTELP
ncbi:hypothetical protein AB833_01910 [Chromatiales bacterium (ex Bugula neritina AB1)]|nr:hypothetical protein AB833_01910 [Chromatiales bacterium (ex Bugula neritina AB1)]